MAELIKWVPDVVFIVLGINSFSRTTLTTIVTTFKAAGIEVVLVTIPKWNFYSGTVVINWQTQKAWKRNCEVQVEIAKECDVAVVNLADIFALGCEGATGISQRDLGECNTLNHMGPLERRKGGEYIALMTFGGRAGLVPSGLPTPVAFKSLDARSSLRTSFALWTPLVGTNGIATIGLSPDYVGVSQVARTLANTSFFTAVPRLGFLSDTTAGSSAGIFGDSLCCWRGNAARLGGFCLTMRFGVNAWQTNGRLFAGLRSSAAAIGNVDPSSLVNIVGVGADAGQTTLRLLTNDGSGTATATDLGARFPINTSSTEVYELTLSCEPNSSVIRWRLERLNTAANDIVEGEVSANLPVNSVFLTPHLWINNGATAAAVAVDLVQMQLALMTR
jgi:hypothetical protein